MLKSTLICFDICSRLSFGEEKKKEKRLGNCFFGPRETLIASLWVGRDGVGLRGGSVGGPTRDPKLGPSSSSPVLLHAMDCGVITSKTVLLLLSLAFWVPPRGAGTRGGTRTPLV